MFRHRLFLILLLSVASSLARSTPPETDEHKKMRFVSECFFIYAPLLEVAKQHNISDLKNYALIRLKYLQGYLDAKKNDREFELVFKTDLDVHKREGKDITNKLEQAIATGDRRLYNEQLQLGELCDSLLGIKVE